MPSHVRHPLHNKSGSASWSDFVYPITFISAWRNSIFLCLALLLVGSPKAPEVESESFSLGSMFTLHILEYHTSTNTVKSWWATYLGA